MAVKEEAIQHSTGRSSYLCKTAANNGLFAQVIANSRKLKVFHDFRDDHAPCLLLLLGHVENLVDCRDAF
jgi:hypothetical protein